MHDAEERKIEVVWPRRNNGRQEASEEDYECGDGMRKTSGRPWIRWKRLGYNGS